MHVREWGPSDGRPLVFWHALGAGTSGAYLTEVAPTLTAAGLHLIAPDAPGFGQSPPLPREGYGVASLAELIRELLDERAIARAILMGHSWGGTLVTAFAAAHPDRVDGLVLVDSGHMDYQDAPGFPHGKSLEQLIEDARAPGRSISTTHEQFERDAQEGVRRPVTPALLEAFRAGLREEDGRLVSIVTPEVRGAVLHGVTQVRVTDSFDAIAAAEIPILLLLATEPEETKAMNERAAEEFAGRLPRSDIHFIEGAGHDLFADAGPHVARFVVSWVQRLFPHA